jgi:haloacetate dehalogenase
MPRLLSNTGRRSTVRRARAPANQPVGHAACRPEAAGPLFMADDATAGRNAGAALGMELRVPKTGSDFQCQSDIGVTGGAMFEGFCLEPIKRPEATLRVRSGGRGPPVLLLPGHPRTHATWRRVAPRLAACHTVVCPDLRGFGQSSKPVDRPDHAGSSKRAKAHDGVTLMRYLGFERFAVVGHDRGSYVAFRMALDHPDAITHLAVLDGVPILEALKRCDARFARSWWQWFFFAQPGKPEPAILADPHAWYGGSPERMGEEAYEDYREAIQDPETVHGMMEDDRAGLGIDREHDAADRQAGRQVACPVLVLWSQDDELPELYGDVLTVWRPWAPDLRGRGLDCGHHMSEEAPAELASALLGFLGSGGKG